MTRRRMSLIAALAAAVTFSATASTAQATTFSDVNPLFCAIDGGQTTRPAGTELRLRMGENSYDLGNLIAWRNPETTTVSINGGPLVDLTNNFDAITFEDPFYVTRNFYDTGIVLQPRGKRLGRLRPRAFARGRVRNQCPNINPGNHPVFFEPATSLAEGVPAAPWACTITGV